MQLLNLFILSLLCLPQSVYSDAIVPIAVASGHTIAQSPEPELNNQKNSLASIITAPDNKTPVTNAIVDLGIPLKTGLNHPAPGLDMQLYTKVDGHITVETEITLQEDELPHPLVAKFLAIIGYEPFECGYFWSTEPKVSKIDSDTKLVSVKRPYKSLYPHEVHIKLHILLNDQQISKYRAILKARRERHCKSAALIY